MSQFDLGEDPQNIDKLDPELRDYVIESEFGTGLQHPYVSQPMFFSWKMANDILAHKNQRAAEYRAAGNLDGLMFLYERPYRLPMLETLWKIGQIDAAQLRELLPGVWVDAEPATELRWFPLFKAARKAGGPLVTPKFPLPDADPITVYRGQKTRARRELGIAWSTDIKTAEFFAKRMGGEGWIVKATVPRRHVWAYFDDRGESELITHPTFVTVVSYQRVSGRQASGVDKLWQLHAGGTQHAVKR